MPKKEIKSNSDVYEIYLGTFIDNAFTWYSISKHKDPTDAYKEFKKYVNTQLKYTDEELQQVWDTGRLDIELRQGNKLLNWVGIYSREVKPLNEKEEKEAEEGKIEKKADKDETETKKDSEPEFKPEDFPSRELDLDALKKIRSAGRISIDESSEMSEEEIEDHQDELEELFKKFFKEDYSLTDWGYGDLEWSTELNADDCFLTMTYCPEFDRDRVFVWGQFKEQEKTKKDSVKTKELSRDELDTLKKLQENNSVIFDERSELSKEEFEDNKEVINKLFDKFFSGDYRTIEWDADKDDFEFVTSIYVPGNKRTFIMSFFPKYEPDRVVVWAGL